MCWARGTSRRSSIDILDRPLMIIKMAKKPDTLGRDSPSNAKTSWGDSTTRITVLMTEPAMAVTKNTLTT
jgi:hypothetical protein